MNNDQYDLISVIVPVYNVGKALIDKCVNSIIRQTYCILEIILVDDGSTDDSGRICDLWASMDKRIEVIHRENGGLSAARNSGTCKAKGKYILYVDSDDWIEDNMVEFLYRAMVKTNSDMSICGIYSTNGEKKVPLLWFEKDCVLTKEAAYAELIYNTKITSHAWNKMYKASIIKEFPFPVGKLYEDIRMMHTVFRACNKIAIVKDYLYNYYRRPESISSIPKLHNRIEFSKAFQDRYEYVLQKTPEYSDLVLSQMASSIALSLVQCEFSNEDIESHKKDLKEIRAFLRRTDIQKVVFKYSSNSVKKYTILAILFGYKSNILYRVILKRFTRRYKEWN